MEWIHLLQTGDFAGAAAQVDPAVPEGSLGETQLGPLWAQVSGQLGALQSLEPGSVDEIQVYHRANLQAVFENAEVVLRVVLNSDLQVSGLSDHGNQDKRFGCR